MSAFASTQLRTSTPPPHSHSLSLTPLWLSELLLQQYPIITISPSWATASHYHAALLIFLSYQLANHKPLSLMARFGARRYSFCRSNPARRVLRITWRYVSLSFLLPSSLAVSSRGATFSPDPSERIDAFRSGLNLARFFRLLLAAKLGHVCGEREGKKIIYSHRSK